MLIRIRLDQSVKQQPVVKAVAFPANRVAPGSPASPASLVVLEFPAPLVSPVVHHQFASLSPNHHVANAHLVILEILAPLANLAPLAHPASPEDPATMDRQDLPDHRDLQVRRDNPDVTALAETPVVQLFQHQHCPVILDPPVTRDHPDCPVSPDNQDVTANQAHPDRKDLQDHQDRQGSPAKTEIQDQKDHPACKVNVVSARNIARWMVASSSKTAREESRTVAHMNIIISSNITAQKKLPVLLYTCTCSTHMIGHISHFIFWLFSFLSYLRLQSKKVVKYCKITRSLLSHENNAAAALRFNPVFFTHCQ